MKMSAAILEPRTHCEGRGLRQSKMVPSRDDAFVRNQRDSCHIMPDPNEVPVALSACFSDVGATRNAQKLYRLDRPRLSFTVAR